MRGTTHHLQGVRRCLGVLEIATPGRCLVRLRDIRTEVRQKQSFEHGKKSLRAICKGLQLKDLTISGTGIVFNACDDLSCLCGCQHSRVKDGTCPGIACEEGR